MSPFTVAYAPERAQYCVERADGLRIFPMPQEYSDPDAGKRAVKLAEVLNRMEREPTLPNGAMAHLGNEPTPDIPPDFCYACDLAVRAAETPYSTRCPECGAEIALGTGI